MAGTAMVMVLVLETRMRNENVNAGVVQFAL
jgi:hypothetical protein